MRKPKLTEEQWIERKKKSRERAVLYSRNYNNTKRIQLRRTILELLGNKCVKCGFTDVRALQIDHIFGDGCSERRRLGGANSKNKGISPLVYYPAIIKSILSGEKRHQLLCANCNWIKKHENNEGPSLENKFISRLKNGVCYN